MSSRRLHSELFDTSFGWHKEWLDPEFIRLVQELQTGNESIFYDIARTETEGVYSFPMLTEHFATLLLEEVANYKSTGLPAPRPNSMNNYGLIVNDIGLRGMMTLLQKEYLEPIARFLYPLVRYGSAAVTSKKYPI